MSQQESIARRTSIAMLKDRLKTLVDTEVDFILNQTNGSLSEQTKEIAQFDKVRAIVHYQKVSGCTLADAHRFLNGGAK